MAVDLSIVIVNYNVKAYLQQCLYTVFKACNSINAEIFVVDNNSVDDSLEMIKQNFTEVKLIANKENMGFAYACNQAIKESSGKYILLLNPDTIVKEDSFRLCFEFMEKNNDAGALGVKMINGKGKFLPESKRSLPDAKSAFFKMFGLSALFPNSKLFGKYQLRYLNENETHQVEVLSGAFMFIRKTVLDKIGLLDESFFMYGEDIDLSYRILNANLKNYYFPKTTIIHYKGESTKKASLKYVMIFYNAMLIFANKHYKGRRKSLFRALLNIAIYVRASFSIFKRIASAIYLPIIDFVFIYISYHIIVPLWEYYKFSGNKAYSKDLLGFYIPIYIVIWQIFIYFFTKYQVQTKIRHLLSSILIGTVCILALYSLLPESQRYSRALILIGASSSMLISSFNRLLVRLINNKGKGFAVSTKKNALLIGSSDNEAFINYPNLLDKQYKICNQLKFDNFNIGKSEQVSLLIENIHIYKIETLIFFIKNLSANDIINCILTTNSKKLEFKIILPESNSMLGSKSVIDLNKIPHLKINLISNPLNRIKKRLLDLMLALVFLILTPLFLLKNKPKHFFWINWQVLKGDYTWVSYYKEKDYHAKDLPMLKKGVFSLSPTADNTDQEILEINLNYAKNYQIIKDIIIIFNALKTSLNLEYSVIN